MSDFDCVKTRDRRRTRRIASFNKFIFSLEERIYKLDEDIIFSTRAGDLRAVAVLRDLRDTLILMSNKFLEATTLLSESD